MESVSTKIQKIKKFRHIPFINSKKNILKFYTTQNLIFSIIKLIQTTVIIDDIILFIYNFNITKK